MPSREEGVQIFWCFSKFRQELGRNKLGNIIRADSLIYYKLYMFILHIYIHKHIIYMLLYPCLNVISRISPPKNKWTKVACSWISLSVIQSSHSPNNDNNFLYFSSFFIWMISQVTVNTSKALQLQIVKYPFNLNKVAKTPAKFFIGAFYTWQCSGRVGAKLLKYLQPSYRRMLASSQCQEF